MKESKLYVILRPFIKAFIHIFVHPTYIGLENIPKEGRFILAGNHTSILDPLLLISCTKRNIHFLAKDELWKGPKKILFSNLGLIPVNRREKDKNALKEAKKYLKTEKVIGIFPEGTTNKKEELLDFKIGAVKIAYDTNTKIIPFAISGSYRPMKKIRINFGTPISVNTNKLEIENNNLRKTIIKLKKEK